MTFGDVTPLVPSEWNDPDGHVDQCGWCSLVALANKAGAGIPATLAQSKVFGEHACTIAQLNVALLRELGWQAREYAGTYAGVLTLLRPGWAMVAQGYYAALPAPFHRFDDAFAAKGIASVHDTYVQRQPDGSLWWEDPLHHDEAGYRGEPISQANLGAYMTAYHSGAKALLVMEGSHVPSQSGPQEDPVLPVSDPTPAIVSYAVGDPLFDLAGTKLIGFSHAGSQESPYEVQLANGRKYRVVVVTTGGKRQLCLVGTASARPVLPPPAPDCTAAIAAAMAPLQAQIDAFPTQLANTRAAGAEAQAEADAAALAAARPK